MIIADGAQHPRIGPLVARIEDPAELLWIDPKQAAALKDVKERDDVPESEQIGRAIDTWLRTKRVTRKATPRRAAKRRRA